MRILFRFRRLSSLPLNPSPNWRITVKSFATQFSLLEDVSSTSTFRFFSSSSSTSRSPNPEKDSFTVSYLINSCGFSPQSALSASHKVHLVTPEKPDSVISLLRDYGFTDTQLRKLITVFPTVLLYDPEKTLLPKLRFLDSKPFSRADIGRIISSCPMILSRSLENHIIPFYDYFKSILHLDTRVVSAIKRSNWLFLQNVNKNIVPNITALKELGLPESSIVSFVTYFPNAVKLKHGKFGEIVKEVMEIGIDPQKQVFIQAVQVFGGMTQSTREHKMEIFRRWGWNDDEIMALIRVYPVCISFSEKKITGTMDFLVNKMGWKLSAISKFPAALGFSLEKRIIPRCLVGKILMLKGLIKKDLSLATFMSYNEKKFLQRFVIKYQNHIPELLSLYKCEVGVVELLGFASDEIFGNGIKQTVVA